MAGPLAGLKVLEMVGLGPAPFGAMMLADAGAEVLRIHPKGVPPAIPTMNTSYDVLARGRRSVALDLKKPGGPEALLEMAKRADALVEGFRPGVMERLGVGPEECLKVNPRLVYGRMTGWGQDGPLAARAGHDINYISLSGVLASVGVEGGPPVPPLNLVGDFGGGGMLLAFGVLCAVFEARQSGHGQVVDASMVEGSALLSAMIHGFRAAGVWSGRRGQNLLDGGAHFYGAYQCSDGKWISVGAIEPQFYARFLELAGIDDPAFRKQNEATGWPMLKEKLAAHIATRSQADWLERFDGSDCCVTPVLDWDEAATHPHNVARGSFVEIAGVVQPAPAPRFGRTPSAVPGEPSPPAEDGRELLARWGVSAATLSLMARSGAV